MLYFKPPEGTKNKPGYTREVKELPAKIKCISCGRELSDGDPITFCSDCGAPLTISFDPTVAKDLSREKIAEGPYSMWRYRRLLPSVSPLVTLGEGWTSLVSASESFAGEDTNLYFKLEFLNTTCSFKDRGG